jgi:DNA-binding CsgD family transcriptional regulator
MKSMKPAECTAAVQRLSPRQREVLMLLADGLARKQVAAKLGIEISTVNANCEAVYARLGVSSVAQAVSIAARADLS